MEPARPRQRGDGASAPGAARSARATTTGSPAAPWLPGRDGPGARARAHARPGRARSWSRHRPLVPTVARLWLPRRPLEQALARQSGDVGAEERAGSRTDIRDPRRPAQLARLCGPGNDQRPRVVDMVARAAAAATAATDGAIPLRGDVRDRLGRRFAPDDDQV